MQAQGRHLSPYTKLQCEAAAGSTKPDDTQGLSLQAPPTKFHGQQGLTLSPYQLARPLNARPIAPRQAGIQPERSMSLKGSGPLVIQGGGRGSGARRLSPNRDQADQNRMIPGTHLPSREALLLAMGVGKGARPMLGTSATRLSQERARLTDGGSFQAEGFGYHSKTSQTAEPSVNRIISQAPSCSSGARQATWKPAKPPRPPGPPPPHILLEQKKRREMTALQRGANKLTSTQQEGSDWRDKTGGGRGPILPSSTVAATATAAAAAAQQTPNLATSSRSLASSNSSSSGSLILRGSARAGGMHLMQAGATIFSGRRETGKPLLDELLLDRGGGSARGGSVVKGGGDGCVGSGGVIGSGFPRGGSFSSLRDGGGASTMEGGANILTSPTSGPLSLTSSSSAGSLVTHSPSLSSSSEWQEFWDEEVEALYYFNCRTREAQWVRPDGF